MHLHADGIPATMMIIGDDDPTLNIGVAITSWKAESGGDDKPKGAKNGR